MTELEVSVLKACDFIHSKSNRELSARIKILPLIFLTFTAIFCTPSKLKVIINFVSDSSAFFPPTCTKFGENDAIK